MPNTYERITNRIDRATRKIKHNVSKPIAASIVFATFSLLVGSTFTLLSMSKVPDDLGLADHNINPDNGAWDKALYAMFALIAFAAYIPVFLSKKAFLKDLFTSSQISSTVELRESAITENASPQLESQTVTKTTNSKKGKLVASGFGATFRGFGSINGAMSLMRHVTNPYSAFITSFIIMALEAMGQLATTAYEKRKSPLHAKSKIQRGLIIANSVMYPVTQLIQYGYNNFNNIISVGLYFGWFQNDFGKNWDLWLKGDKELDKDEFAIQFTLIAPILALGIYFAHKVHISTMHQWDDLIDRLVNSEFEDRKSALKQVMIGILSGMVKATATLDATYKIFSGVGLNKAASRFFALGFANMAAVAQGPTNAYRGKREETSSTNESMPLLRNTK